MELLARQLASAMPTLRAPRVWLSMLKEALERFEIDSTSRIAAFLAQIARESNECRDLEEDLRYPVTVLMRMWPKRFPTEATAQPYERNPEKLANLVYANRWGNGPPESCDGYRFRGRGLIRITGRANYALAGAALGLDLEGQPEALLVPRNAALSAAWSWKTRGGMGTSRLPFAGELQIHSNMTPMGLFGDSIGARFPAGDQ